jgi:hypothetical protein
MDQMVQPLYTDAKNIVEIVMHITEGLDEDHRRSGVSALKEVYGINDAEFCPLHHHLMLVKYDRKVFSSQDVLRNVTLQNVNARLIGPV